MHFLCKIQFRRKKGWFVFKTVKKIIYFQFLTKFRLTFCFWYQIHKMSAMKPQKLLYQNSLRYLKSKITKGELWIFIQPEIKRYLEQSVLRRQRLRPIRVEKHIITICIKFFLLTYLDMQPFQNEKSAGFKECLSDNLTYRVLLNVQVWKIPRYLY